MYRFLFSPRWLGFHLLVIVGIVLMVNLGFWQLRRLDERQAFNAQVSERIDRAAGAARRRPGGRRRSRRRRVALGRRRRGTYLPDEQFLVVNRSQDGIGGTWSSRRCSSTTGACCSSSGASCPGTMARPGAPAGAVDVVGRLRPSEQRRRAS